VRRNEFYEQETAFVSCEIAVRDEVAAGGRSTKTIPRLPPTRSNEVSPLPAMVCVVLILLTSAALYAAGYGAAVGLASLMGGFHG